MSEITTTLPESPKPVPLKERIRAVLDANGGHMGYHDCMRAVFPEAQYPNAWRYQSNGGPPGCAMPFGKALRELGGRRSGIGGASMVYLPRN